MVLKVQIANNDQSVEVQRGALSVTLFPPPSDTSVQVPVVIPLTINGDGVTTDLKVAGSLTTPIKASVKAASDGDIFITEINVLIVGLAGAGKGKLKDFAALENGITNGCILFQIIKGITVEIREAPLKNNLDWIRIGTKTAPVGDGDSAFVLQDVIPGPSSFAYNPRLDIAATNAPHGLQLKKLSSDEIGILIQDDLDVDDVTAFNITALGFKILR